MKLTGKTGVLVLWIAVALLTGCQKEKEDQIEMLPASTEHFYYAGTEGADRLAVDENGLLYTMKAVVPEMEEPFVGEEAREQIRHYKEISVFDLEGNCIKSELVEAGSGIKTNMVLREEVLYCVMGKSPWEYDKLALFAIDTRDWSVTMLKLLSEYKTVECLAIVGEHLYLLGETQEERLTEEVTAELDSGAYQLRNRVIFRLDLASENQVTERMNLDYPYALYSTDQNTLMIYRYSEKKGFGFLEFDPEQAALTEKAWSGRGMTVLRPSDCEGGFLHSGIDDDPSKMLLFYETMEGQRTQIFPTEVVLVTPAVYRKGFVFMINHDEERVVERVCLENIVKKENTLRVLKLDDNQTTPFECGFLTESVKLADDAFALKVLAQDRDFDLFLLDSKESISHNIKENGVFYPLNEVEGVQEYLDACFPYIKEAATDEEGNIWMLPVKVSFPGLIYNREFCAENGVNLTQMDWNTFLTFTAQVKAENEKVAECTTGFLLSFFFSQYLSQYNTFDTEEFRANAKWFRDTIAEQGSWVISDFTLKDWIIDKTVPDFLYWNAASLRSIERIYRMIPEKSQKLGVTSVPKYTQERKNVGTIAFLAVNPESENLETALDYVSAFAKYIVTEENTFLLAEESSYSDMPFIRDAYELYADGTICFEIDTDIYWNEFVRYLNGDVELEKMIAEIERKYRLHLGE